MSHEEEGGVTPPLASLDTSKCLSSNPPNDSADPPRGTGLVVVSPSADLEAPGHSAQDLTPQQGLSQEKQALALLSIPSLAFNPHLRATPDTLLDHFAKALVDELGHFARSTGLHKQARQPADRLRLNSSIEALTCNLILASVTGARHLTLWLDMQAAEARRYNGECTGLPFRSALDLMKTFEFMRLVQVGLRTSSGVSLPSRFAIGEAFTERWRRCQQAGDLLLDLSSIRDTGTEGAVERPLLVLKGADGEVVAFTETARTKEIHAQVARFNRILSTETPLAIINPDGVPLLKHTDDIEAMAATIDPASRTLHRSFTGGSWEEGGRFHGPFWLTMPREDRYRFLRLGSSFKHHRSQGFAYEEIANIDYRSLYLRLGYLHLGLPVPDGDLYSVPGYAGHEACREGLKIIVNAMLFLEEPLRNWPRKARAHFPKGTTLRDVRAAIWVRHQPIGGLFEALGIGHRFAFHESQMLVQVLRHLWSSKVRVPCLPVHDSVLVARSRAEVAKAAMLSAFEKVTGVQPRPEWVSISSKI